MSHEQPQKHRGLSRRRFLGRIGSGAVATAVVGAGATVAPTDLFPQTTIDGKARITLSINGKRQELEVEARSTLANVLRNRLDLTGTKIVCDHGECGACTVLLDGLTAYSCMLLAVDVVGREITTIEGLAHGDELHPVQTAFIDEDAYQCGFCTPGQIMAVVGLLRQNPHPTLEEVKRGLAGNLCRCATYTHIFNATFAAAEKGGV